MPITISLPQSTDGSWIGPGATIQVQSDFQGPLPSDTQWNYRVELVADTTPVWEEFVFQNVNPSSNVLMVKDVRKSTGRTRDQPTDGQAVSLVLELQTGSGVIDSGRADTTWRTTRGLGQQAFLQPQVQATQDFTAADREALLTTEAAVTEEIQGQVNPAVRTALGALDLVLGFPVNRLAGLECQTLEGRGSLTRPGGGFPVNAFGIAWHIIQVPDGFGFRDGAVKQYYERIAQLVKVNHDANGTEYLDDLVDIQTDGGKIAWSWNNLPSQILYDVTPGCQVQFCWLLI